MPEALARGSRFAGAVICAGLVVAAFPTEIAWSAAPADPEPLIQEGIAFRRVGDDLAALKKFQQAYEMQKAARTIAQIGLAEQALGRWVAADKHLREAVNAGQDPWIKKNRESIDQALRLISLHIGEVDIVGLPAGAEVRVDGELVGRLPLAHPIAANVGGVAVEVRAPGYLPIVRSANIAAGALTRESFNLQRLSPVRESTDAAGTSGQRIAPTMAEAPEGAPRADSATALEHSTDAPGAPEAITTGRPESGMAGGISTQRVLTFAALGLAAGSLAFGIVEHLSWQRKVSSFESNSTCDAAAINKGSTSCMSLYDEGKHAKALAVVGYALTAAFGATAAVVYFMEPRSNSQAQTVACGPSAITMGLSCAGSF